MEILRRVGGNHKRIQELQLKYNFVFPKEYVDLLLSSNGGIIKYNSVPRIGFSNENESILIKEFFGVDVDDEHNIEYYNEKFHDDLDDEAIIIGKDYNDGYIVLFKNKESPIVCYWDEQLNMSLSNQDGNAYIIASTFDEFINLLGGIEYYDFKKGESDMNKVEFYSLGSIVLLEGAFKKLLITSRGLVVKNNDKELFFDYAGVPYPEGLVDDKIAYFNHDNIAKVVFKGFSDDDDKIAIDNINKFIDKHPELERGNINNWTA